MITIQEQTRKLIERAVLDGYCKEKVGREAIKAMNRQAFAQMLDSQKVFVRNLPTRTTGVCYGIKRG